MYSSKRKSPYSKTPKAIKEAEARKKKAQAKRFNDPMRVFLERKYPRIFAEFTELYKYFDFLNPAKKNLCKTVAFIEWVNENPLPAEQDISGNSTIEPGSDIIGKVFREVFGERNAEPLIPDVPLPTPANSAEPLIPDVPLPTPANSAEPLIPDVPLPTPDNSMSETNEMNNVAEDILNEIDEHYDILMEAGDVSDEGIELTTYDELALDFEPFDFNVDSLLNCF